MLIRATLSGFFEPRVVDHPVPNVANFTRLVLKVFNLLLERRPQIAMMSKLVQRKIAGIEADHLASEAGARCAVYSSQVGYYRV